MTTKEKLIVKKLGYVAYAIYQYTKTHSVCKLNIMSQELGLSEASRHRRIQSLIGANILKCIRENESWTFKFEINEDKEWQLD